jgi:ring-1,2-phenylacetyl-CoA epoxidase subunit PaaC
MTARAQPMAGATGLDEPVREALARLLLAMADDEFVLGYWDSEWTGIAPVLEEDVAFSSLAQDEIGHANALYQLYAELTGEPPDGVAYGREADEYRHARLLDHARGDWAFSVARRFLYDTADAVRLDALAGSAWPPLAGLVAKLRREEVYHLAHGRAWMERLAARSGQPRERLAAALRRLWPDALTVLSPLPGEDTLVAAGILPEPMATLRDRWLDALAPLFDQLDLDFPFERSGGRWTPRPGLEVAADKPDQVPGGQKASWPAARDGRRGDDFRWLWGEFTLVARSDPGATW